jgi:hypothetical protein
MLGAGAVQQEKIDRFLKLRPEFKKTISRYENIENTYKNYFIPTLNKISNYENTIYKMSIVQAFLFTFGYVCPILAIGFPIIFVFTPILAIGEGLLLIISIVCFKYFYIISNEVNNIFQEKIVLFYKKEKEALRFLNDLIAYQVGYLYAISYNDLREQDEEDFKDAIDKCAPSLDWDKYKSLFTLKQIKDNNLIELRNRKNNPHRQCIIDAFKSL